MAAVVPSSSSPEPRRRVWSLTRLDVLLVVLAAVLSVWWAVRMMQPLQRELDRTRAVRTELAAEVERLTRDVVRLDKSVKLLQHEDPYLWARVIRKELRVARPGEQRVPVSTGVQHGPGRLTRHDRTLDSVSPAP